MAAAKPSVRFSATILADSPSSNYPSGMHMNSPDSLADLDSEWITTDGYIEPKYQSLTEKGIRLLCSELLELKKASAEEMRKNVYANHTAFIRTSQELGELETELINMRGLISTHAVLVRDVFEGVIFQQPTNPKLATGPQTPSKEDEEHEVLELQTCCNSLSDAFDVCLAERKVDEALSILNEAEMILSEAHANATCFAWSFSERKAKLVAQLVEAAWQSYVHGNELRKVISILNQLGDGARAHTLLLNSYHMRIQNGVTNLRPTCSWYSGTYIAALAQLYFSIISQASQDSVKIFGTMPACASELVLWACKETEDYISLLKKHISSLSVVSSGVGAAAECVHISLAYCAILEKQGLSLSPLLLKSLKPCMEGVLERCFTRMEECLRAHVASDDWILKQWPTSHVKLSSSAQKFNSMVQDFVEDIAPMMPTQFGKLALDGVSNMFSLYVKMLMQVLPRVNNDVVQGKVDDTNIVNAKSEAQKLAILGNAAALAEELLPMSVSRWKQSGFKELKKQGQEGLASSGIRFTEQKDWRRHLQQLVDDLRDHLAEHHLCAQDDELLLSANTYLSLQKNERDRKWYQNPTPSSAFQALFKKLKTLEEVTDDVLAGRERVIAMLLMRVMEVFLMRLAKDEHFWRSFEDVNQDLGSLGLHQFVLDMHFAIRIASAGRYASRKMRQTVTSMISHAEDAFSAKGVSSDRVLEDDQWFEENAKEAMCKILEEIAAAKVKDEQEPDLLTSICEPVSEVAPSS